MKCKCGNEITIEQDKENQEIADMSKTEKLNMCKKCWTDYCDHAVDGV